jgi:hypothetical protein
MEFLKKNQLDNDIEEKRDNKPIEERIGRTYNTEQHEKRRKKHVAKHIQHK